jgi:hypothetical protein
LQKIGAGAKGSDFMWEDPVPQSPGLLNSGQIVQVENGVPVVLYVEDFYGNVDSCEVVITIIDTIPPNAICKDTMIFLDENGTVELSPGFINNGSNDVCGIESLVLENYTFDCSSQEESIVKLTVIDNNGNSSFCTSTVTIFDTIPPKVNCRNIDIYLNNNGLATISPEMIDGGSIDNCGISMLRLSKRNFTCDNLGENNIRLLAIDNRGNKSSCNALVTVIDLIVPIAICRDTVLELDQSGYAHLYPRDISGESFDNCDVRSWMLSHSIFTCNDLGKNEVYSIVGDPFENKAKCTAVVNVIDVSEPVVNCGDTALYLDLLGGAEINFKDITLNSYENCSELIIEPESKFFNCAHLSDTKQVVAPWINEFHYDNFGADIDEFIEIAGKAGEDLGGYQLVLYNGDSGKSYKTINLKGIFPNEQNGFGVILIMIPGIQNGNSDGFALVDVELKVIEFLSYEGIINAIDGPAQGLASFDISVEENGNSLIGSSLFLINKKWHVSLSASEGFINPGQNLTSLFGKSFEITMSDISGNNSSCESKIAIVDTIPPKAICHDIQISLDQLGSANINASTIDNGSFDNCSIEILELNQTNFNCNHLGENQVILSVVDFSGNISSCQATVLVNDTIAPLALCNSISVVLDMNGEARITPDLIDNGSTDNCLIKERELNTSFFDCDSPKETIVWLSITDSYNNIATCQ